MGQLLDAIYDVISGGKDGDQTRASQGAVDVYKNLNVPSVEDLTLQLDRLVQVGILTPEMAEIFLMSGTAYDDITEDPALRNAQMKALGQLQELAEGGGLNASDKARIAKLQSTLSQMERGNREAIMQNAQERGVGGSGFELFAQMQNQQDSAGRASQQAMDIEALAQERALQAMRDSGVLAGNIRGQEWDQASQVAAARDAVDRFNTETQNRVTGENVDRANRASEMNLAEEQRIADENVNISNTEEESRAEAVRDVYDMERTKAAGMSNAYSGLADTYGGQADRRVGLVGGGVEAGGKAAAAAAPAAAAAASDERVKTNVEDFDASKFLDAITGYKYTYKKPEEHGEGPQVGIMAQDLEKVAPQAVEEDVDDVKRIDYNKLGGPIMAALADMNDRIKKVEDK